ncbi:hypothetical protein [Solitalea lacus]|uniref:hypothetical protein n=1 Tax=Solitalea lacus TaxID=2911172 RepID=UPI001EDBEB84|nr:hypothetical protein [Solitalea lacus]UKJ07505.1 hypothetical protein L2B55_18550 [Solitalea lacus]
MTLNSKSIKFDKISVYAFNSENADGEYVGLVERFAKYSVFSLKLVNAEGGRGPEIDLLQAIKSAVLSAQQEERQFFLLCNTSHYFTNDFSYDNFLSIISEADKKNADYLLGGLTRFRSPFQVSENLYWVEKFLGIHFMVIFQRSYEKILGAELGRAQSVHELLSSISESKFIINPLISIQEDIQYDFEDDNGKQSNIVQAYLNSKQLLNNLNNIRTFYREHQSIWDPVILEEPVAIPTYILNLPERTDRLAHIKGQFEGRTEFDITFVEACRHEIGAVGLWQSIRKIVRMAIDNDDDVIVICEDDHQFTPYYNRDYFLKNVLEAHSQRTDYLNGGIAIFNNAVMVAENRFWVDIARCTQFIILYRSFFQKVLDSPYNDDVLADVKLSELTANKLALHPFISIQKDFGYSDVTAVFNNKEGLSTKMFNECSKMLQNISMAYSCYCK